MGLGVYEAMVLERSSRFEEEKSARRYISSIEAAISIQFLFNPDMTSFH